MTIDQKWTEWIGRMKTLDELGRQRRFWQSYPNIDQDEAEERVRIIDEAIASRISEGDTSSKRC